MKTSIKGVLAMLLSGTATIPGAQAAERVYTYADENSALVSYNTYRSETLSLAIKIDNPLLAGKNIVRLRAKIDPSLQEVSDCKLWLSRSLSVKKENGKIYNDPDILSEGVTPDKDGWLDLELATPLVAGKTAIYAGYTLTIEKFDTERYSPVVYYRNRHNDGFYFLSSIATTKWMDYENKVKGVAPIYVTFEGDFNEYEIGIISWDTEDPAAQTGSDFTLPLRVCNTGTRPVSRLGYTYSCGGSYSGSSELTLTEPILPTISDYTVVTLPFEAMYLTGEQDLKLTIGSVDGVENAGNGTTLSLPVDFRDFVPVQRVLLEEATGTWCSACPRGTMAFKALGKLYGSRFVGVAYHGGKDPMVTSFEIPFTFSGYPSASLDRGPTIDPYYGDQKSQTDPFYINVNVDQTLRNSPRAGIEASAFWADPEATRIDATAKVKFLEPAEAEGCKVEFLLLANGLKGDTAYWWQVNGINDRDPAALDEVLAPLAGAGNPIKDIAYDHVAVIARHDQIALPEADSDGFHSIPYSFNPAEAVSAFDSTAGESLIQNRENLAVVVMLLNPEGKVINCVESHVENAGDSSVGAVTSATETIIREYFDLTGRRVSSAYCGLRLVRETLTDGTQRTRKELHR